MSAHPSGTLRLVWPQWQGAGTASTASLTGDLPAENARNAYAVGTRVLDALIDTPGARTAAVPVPSLDDPTVTDGVESKPIVLEQLRAALAIIETHNPARILTIGGDCAVSAAPFAAMAERYGDDLAIIWVDSHPDLDTPDTDYAGYHAMVLSHLIGKGDADTLALLPATVAPARVAIAGLHSWTADVTPHLDHWGITAFAPESLRATSAPLLAWLHRTGCTKVAIHFDVDVVDSNDLILGLGAEPDGLTLAQASRLVGDIGNAADVVALTIAEYIPRQVIRLMHALNGFPLIDADPD